MTVQTDLLDEHELSFDDKPFLDDGDDRHVPFGPNSGRDGDHAVHRHAFDVDPLAG